VSRPRVILVEDEGLVAMAMEDILTDLGFDVVAAFGELAPALRWLGGQVTPPDGALLDVNLGGEMVFPLAEALQERGVPFIFATGYGVLADKRFPEAPLLHKPVDETKLATVIDVFRPAA
jgi:two-component SAPR family response regulator